MLIRSAAQVVRGANLVIACGCTSPPLRIEVPRQGGHPPRRLTGDRSSGVAATLGDFRQLLERGPLGSHQDHVVLVELLGDHAPDAVVAALLHLATHQHDFGVPVPGPVG